MSATERKIVDSEPAHKDLALNLDEHEPGTLYSFEIFWKEHQKWLDEQGYLLRPRFRHDWVPSWQGTKLNPSDTEDGQTFFRHQIMDATRKSDGAIVALKRVSKTRNPYELEITQLFSTEPLAADPRNHCIPVYEVLQSPDEDIILMVMPYLCPYDSPRFASFGEVIGCFRQLFEGLQFIHQHRVVHRDIHNLNIMMNPLPLVSEMYHPVLLQRSYDNRRKVKLTTRTSAPTKYFYIDFGVSRKYAEDCSAPREVPIWGGDRTVPEFQHSNDPCDPFPTDIYYLGNFLREEFIQRCFGFEFLEPLVQDMVQDDPTKRPTIDEAIERFDKVRSSLSSWKLRSRVVRRKDNDLYGLFRTLKHAYRTLRFIVTRTPAVPTP